MTEFLRIERPDAEEHAGREGHRPGPAQQVHLGPGGGVPEQDHGGGARPEQVPLASSGPAADYPVRPVKWIVPYPPGGGLDLPGRAVSERFAQQTGKPLRVKAGFDPTAPMRK